MIESSSRRKQRRRRRRPRGLCLVALFPFVELSDRTTWPLALGSTTTTITATATATTSSINSSSNVATASLAESQDYLSRKSQTAWRRRKRRFSRIVGSFGLLDSLPLGQGKHDEEPWNEGPPADNLKWHEAPALTSIPKNITQKVTCALRHHWQTLRANQTSTLLSDGVVGLSLVTVAQALHTTVASSRGLVRQTVSTVIATPTQLAWEHIKEVYAQVQAEPSLWAWRQYSPHVVWQSLQAIRRLQRALPKTTTTTTDSTTTTCHNDRDNNNKGTLDNAAEMEMVVKDLAYYSVYATLAYGWPMALARMAQGQGRWRGGGSLQSLLQQTGLNESNILQAQWQAETRRPAFLLVQDPHQKAIVLTIRGTWSASDVLTDLCCTTTEVPLVSNDTLSTLWQWLIPPRYTALEAHNGMVQAALALQESLYTSVAAALREYPDHRLVLVGHSMGGGAAALLGLLWQNTFDKDPVVYVYGPPCVAPLESPLTDHGQIHSVVLPGDPFCTLSLGHVIELAATVGYFAKHDALRRRICRRHVSSRYAEDIWSHLEETVWSKRRQPTTTTTTTRAESCLDDNSAVPPTKLVPPGKVWRLVPQHAKGGKKDWRLERACTREFLELSMQPFAMDLTRHAPTLYEACLQRALCNV